MTELNECPACNSNREYLPFVDSQRSTIFCDACVLGKENTRMTIAEFEKIWDDISSHEQ
jgi:hypothetical protein